MRIVQTPAAALALTLEGDEYDAPVRSFRRWLADRPLTVDSLRDRVAELVAEGHHGGAISAYFAVRKRVLTAFERSPDALDLGKRHQVETELDGIRRLVPKVDRGPVSSSRLLS